jgi:methyl-accepting chemotaxis protein
MPQIQEAFNNVISVIKPLWEGYCQLLAPAFQAAFDAVKAVLDLLFNAIISVIDMLTGIFTADKELFMQGLTMFLQSIWTYLVQWWTILYTWITTTINTFLAWFGTSLEDIVTRITEFFKNLLDTIVEKVTEIVDWVTEKINEICDFISSLPERFYQWGVEMIQNLAQGIRDTIGAVTEAISSVAEAIAEFIHFSEPDKGPLSNFNSFMPDMMKQMAQGIEKGRWQVQAAAANVARDIAAPIATTNNVTLNNSFTFGGGYTEADGRDIVRKINRQLGALYI